MPPCSRPSRSRRPASPASRSRADAAVLEQPGPLPRLAVGPAADLDQHRVDAAQREQMRQQQPGRAGLDDAYLGARARLAAAPSERVGRDLAAHR